MSGEDAQDPRIDLVPGMGTGNDEGPIGDAPPEGPMDEDDAALLRALQVPGEGEIVHPVEETPEMAAAVDDDAPLPSKLPGGPDDDPDTVRFSNPQAP